MPSHEDKNWDKGERASKNFKDSFSKKDQEPQKDIPPETPKAQLNFEPPRFHGFQSGRKANRAGRQTPMQQEPRNSPEEIREWGIRQATELKLNQALQEDTLDQNHRTARDAMAKRHAFEAQSAQERHDAVEKRVLDRQNKMGLAGAFYKALGREKQAEDQKELDEARTALENSQNRRSLESSNLDKRHGEERAYFNHRCADQRAELAARIDDAHHKQRIPTSEYDRGRETAKSHGDDGGRQL